MRLFILFYVSIIQSCFFIDQEIPRQVEHFVWPVFLSVHHVADFHLLH